MDATPSISELFPAPAANNAIGRAPEDLGQEDFLELMVAQLENQDPTKPMDNFEFLSQIAQFGTVEGIQNIEQGFAELTNVLYASQSLQAASLVGSKVVTESNLGQLPTEGTLDATVNVPTNTSQVQVYVQDTTGRLVHTQNLGAASSGELNYQWDGLLEGGGTAPAGQYRISAEAIVGGEPQALSVHTHSLVESVTIDQASAGVQLNLAGGNSISLGEVKSFL